ncbi:hypothetical protein Indivirus_17_2 [Indivirus ILV1]|uniref:Uncharacterized protein n=1 Tax=Indivirus ILV1 TaxID=1977633 RepID=A0A1V0SEQ7_9VIRU|nr:hypothetical protein Indivirus_17_2 [Indivirus ILV1]
MSIIDLFWHLDISDTSKYLIICSLFVCLIISCTLAGKRNKKKKFKKIKNEQSS